jgi:hypothetical protein
MGEGDENRRRPVEHDVRIEVGKEVQYAQRRLNDIIFLAEKTGPAHADDWEGYIRELKAFIIRQANDALTALSVRH